MKRNNLTNAILDLSDEEMELIDFLVRLKTRDPIKRRKPVLSVQDAEAKFHGLRPDQDSLQYKALYSKGYHAGRKAGRKEKRVV